MTDSSLNCNGQLEALSKGFWPIVGREGGEKQALDGTRRKEAQVGPADGHALGFFT